MQHDCGALMIEYNTPANNKIYVLLWSLAWAWEKNNADRWMLSYDRRRVLIRTSFSALQLDMPVHLILCYSSV